MPGKAIDPGDRLKTGPDGKILLRLSDGSTLSIGNSTDLELTEFVLKGNKRKGLFAVSAGKLRAAINRFSGETDIKVRTPASTSGVKGTDFIVLAQNGSSVLFGSQGHVEVSGDGPGGAVTLAPDTMTESTSGGSPIEPVPVEPGGALFEARSVLEEATDVLTPVEWDASGRLPAILARWNINYSHYLTDAGRPGEALEVLAIARDLADAPEQKAEAGVERAALLSNAFKDLEGALAEYSAVVESYPAAPSHGSALFGAAMVSMELGRDEAALGLFRRYVGEYPDGGQRETALYFIGVLEKR